MEGRKSFASALLHQPLSIPTPVNKPTAWESYLLQELKKLQGEMAAMKQEISKKDEQIARLQQKLDETQGNSQQTGAESTNKVDLTTQLSEVKLSSSTHFSKEVMAVVKEQELVDGNKKVIRIGGLPLGWDREDIAPELKDDCILETEVLKAQLTKVVPFINLGSPVFITPKGTQARVSYFDMSDKIAVMKQAKSLQGTKVWIADELTPLQLKNRPTELTKVREARKNGKWAVYRGGQAIIRDFHTHTT
ncbi:hypothetical protein KP509_25G065400 [Ceratopteris richardii]|uniref:Uncharacterized protein n=1 Tax=Ceratopteris richardii TaxID=49495 RepID=A0A8T2RTG3_CERRI|nr:hypothetical protein KP509_25G065400 [Ceratopteris richardii]